MTGLPSQGGTSFGSPESRLESAPDNMEPVNNFLHMVSLWSLCLIVISPPPIFFPPLSSSFVLSPHLSPSLTSLFPPLSSSLFLSPSGHLGERALHFSGRKAADSDPVSEPAGWDLHGACISFWSIQNSCPTHGFSLQCPDSPQLLIEGEQCGR